MPAASSDITQQFALILETLSARATVPQTPIRSIIVHKNVSFEEESTSLLTKHAKKATTLQCGAMTMVGASTLDARWWWQSWNNVHASIKDIGDLLDYDPKGISHLILRVRSNAGAVTVFDTYMALFGRIQCDRLDITRAFAALVPIKTQWMPLLTEMALSWSRKVGEVGNNDIPSHVGICKFGRLLRARPGIVTYRRYAQTERCSPKKLFYFRYSPTATWSTSYASCSVVFWGLRAGTLVQKYIQCCRKVPMRLIDLLVESTTNNSILSHPSKKIFGHWELTQNEMVSWNKDPL